MKSNRTIVLGAVLALLGVPVVVAVSEAVSFAMANAANGSIVSSGVERYYVLHVPASYDRAKPTPLVISMHGAGLWGAAQREISRWNELADREGIIVVYPSAVAGRGPRVWRPSDERFIADLIDTLRATYNIDATRIYANGLSNGGGQSFALSCTLSDRIAAVGLVASALTLPWKWCSDTSAVPMIAIHGTADPATPYRGSTTWISPKERPFPDIPTWVASWSRRNRCARQLPDSAVRADVIRRAYTSCADGADVVLYTIVGGGHVWPGGAPLPEWIAGPPSNSIDATSELWAFFRAHRLRGR